MLHLTRKSVRAHGVALNWVEAGAGPPLVLIHGLGDSHRTWKRVIPALSEHRRVYAVDLPGHGMSERPNASYELPWHARVLGLWLDYLELDQFDLAGHSYGGGVAQFLLLTHAERVRRLALVSSGGLGREVHLALRLLALPIGPRLFQPFMNLGTRVGFGLVGGKHFGRGERRSLSKMNGVPGTARALARTIRGVIDRSGQHTHFLDHAHRIERMPPMRLFWGDRDPVVPVSHGEAALRYFDHVDMIQFRKAGHFPHVSHPERFVAEVIGFFQEPELRRATLHWGAWRSMRGAG